MDRGIYAIINIINDNMYIGSAVSFKLRWKNHQIGLRTGKHHNKHLLSAYAKYGESSFIYVKLEILSDKENLIKREQWWMDALKPLYNKAPKAGSALGVKHSKETLDKLSAIRKGKKRSEEFCKALSERGKGRTVSDETRQKMRDSHKGKSHHTEEHKQKLSERMKGNTHAAGIKHTPERIEARAVLHRGKSKSDEHKAKIAAGNSGKVVSEQSRINMSIAAKIRYAKDLTPEQKSDLKSLMSSWPDSN